MEQKGGSPLLSGIILIIGFLVFFFLYVFLSEPLGEVWDASHEASPSSTPDIWGNLSFVWMAIPVVAVVVMVVWYFARIHSEEYEVSFR